MVSSILLSEPHGRGALDVRARSEAEVHRPDEEEAHCGAPKERALTAVQFEQDEKAMALRALALQEQARRIQSGEIVCVANHDVETKSCLPFLIGKVCQTPLLAFGDSFFKSKR